VVVVTGASSDILNLPCAVIVLAHEMDRHGEPDATTKSRLALAVDLLTTRPDAKLVTSGWAYRNDTKISLADAVANAATRDHGVTRERVVALDTSRDTVGDAIFFRQAIKAREVHVVTSSYHQDRALRVFRFVLGLDVALEVHGTGPPATPEQKRAEAASIAAFERTFAGIASGDFGAMLARLTDAHPFYNGTVDVKALRGHD
jgi:DUF218 domain